MTTTYNYATYHKNSIPFFGMLETTCCGCDNLTTVNHMVMCVDCYEKFDRDIIRRRDWDLSLSACQLSEEHKELLRNDIIRTYGVHPELITAREPAGRRNSSKTRKKRKR